LLSFLLLFLGTAYAAPPPNPDPVLHAWFDNQYSLAGGWCCRIADGHILSDEEWRSGARGYEVFIGGEWRTVEPETMRNTVRGGPNPTGHAIVWHDAGFRIWCFAPGTEY
jgi:hypothetical protein